MPTIDNKRSGFDRRSVIRRGRAEVAESAQVDCHLAEVGRRRQVLVSGRRFVERKDLLDHRVDTVRREKLVETFEMPEGPHANAVDARVLELQG